MRHYSRLPPLFLLSLVSICCCGCIAVPIRVPTKAVGTTGDTGKKVDLSFIVAGTTPRNEVAQRLAWVDSGIKNDRFFVARWTQSSWGVAWAVGGYYAADAGWNRSWIIRYLVVEFDQQGLTEKFSFVDDHKLAETLTPAYFPEFTRFPGFPTPLRNPHRPYPFRQAHLGHADPRSKRTEIRSERSLFSRRAFLLPHSATECHSCIHGKLVLLHLNFSRNSHHHHSFQAEDLGRHKILHPTGPAQHPSLASLRSSTTAQSSRFAGRW